MSPGAFICMEGTQCASLPLVFSGTARVYKMAETGREITLYRIEPGGSCIITASCLLSDRTFPAFAVAETEVEAVLIPMPVFHAWFRHHDAWRRYLFDLLSSRLASVIELVEEVAFQRMDVRLAAYLVHAADASGEIERTHEVVAVDLGTSREVISRLLKDFERRGFVVLSRGIIRVRDREGLRRSVKKG